MTNDQKTPGEKIFTNLEHLLFNGVIEPLFHFMTIIWYHLKDEFLLNNFCLLS